MTSGEGPWDHKCGCDIPQLDSITDGLVQQFWAWLHLFPCSQGRSGPWLPCSAPHQLERRGLVAVGMTQTSSVLPQLPLSCTSAPQHQKPQCHQHPEARKAQKPQSVLLLVTTHDTKWLRTSAEVRSTQHPAGSFQKLGSTVGQEQSHFPCCTCGSVDLRTRNEPNSVGTTWRKQHFVRGVL